MAKVLRGIQHLVRYAHWSYMNDDGAEFRSAAADLHGEVRYRKLEIVTPFFKHHLRLLTPNTHVHLGLRGNDNTLVLAFRGTDFPFTVEQFVNPRRWWGFWGNVWTDVAFHMNRISWLPPDSEILVHEGFLAAFNNLLDDDRLRMCMLHLLGRSEVGVEPSKIEVCGHSLGAALATLCALWCKIQWPNAKVTCVTVGSPRVGNEALVDEFSKLHITCFRLLLDNDPIPTVPDRFTQALPGKVFRGDPRTTVDRKYRHVGVPILLHAGKGVGVNLSWVELGVERPDIAAEEEACPLPWPFTAAFWIGGFAPYWALRGARMAPGVFLYHDPAWYSTVVQRVLERAGGETNTQAPLHESVLTGASETTGKWI
ncbi:hypothetical protein VTK26DRAFT_180 [Humicola hyalothermophila]